MNKAFEKIFEMLGDAKDGYSTAQLMVAGEDVALRRFIAKEKAIDLAIQIVQQVSEEYNNGWIPCSDRLPEEDGFYLATLDGEIAGSDKTFSGIAEFENGKWVDDEDDYQCIIAWQPLPEPYRQEGDET